MKQQNSVDIQKLHDDVTGTSELARAAKLGRRAARLGFDWPDWHDARAKISEELEELDVELRDGSRARIGEEIGDLLFAVVNLCRHMELDPEQCVHGTNQRFETRFRHVEQCVEKSGRGWDGHTLGELDAYWNEAKRLAADDAERGQRSGR